MSERRSFIERALSGDVLELSTIDDAIHDWHASTGDRELHDWLGMTTSEYRLFVERPDALRLILLARKHGSNLLELLRATDEGAVLLAARGASQADIAAIRTWLVKTGRL